MLIGYIEESPIDDEVKEILITNMDSFDESHIDTLIESFKNEQMALSSLEEIINAHDKDVAIAEQEIEAETRPIVQKAIDDFVMSVLKESLLKSKTHVS